MVNAAAPTALVPQNTKVKKGSGSLSRGGALERSPGKGEKSFLKLMAANLGGGDRKVPLDGLVEALKTAASAVGAAKAGQGAQRKLTPQVALQNEVVAPETVAKDEKAESRKKPVHVHAAATAAKGGLIVPESIMKTEGAAFTAKPDSAGEVQAGQGATAVARHASTQRSEPNVHIIDLRRKVDARAADDMAAALKNAQAGTTEREPTGPFAQRLGAAREIATVDSPKAAPSTAQPQQTTLERLREMAGSELVKATGIVLREGGGEIRLVLKPESLGSVRIRMNIVDNVIEGRIIVDSSAVKQVFDSSLDALRRALTAEGFQTASLQVSVGGQNASADGRQEQETPAAARAVTAQGFERNIPGLESVSLGELLVNLFV